jgi:hypothetical protein
VVPYQDRKSRDLFCLLVYILFWLGMLGIAGISFVLGEKSAQLASQGSALTLRA